MNEIWQESLTVRIADVDKTRQLMVSAVFDMFQNAAVKHAEVLGVGKIDMEKNGIAWILSRMSVYVERRPCLDSQLTVKTWPRGSHKIFAVRDYEIKDKDDVSIVRGRSGWLIVDTEKKRPMRSGALVSKLPLNEGLDALDYDIEAIESTAGLVKTGERRAAYTDIDYLGHVNNTRYIQWVQDALEPELLYDAAKYRLDINYIAEVLPSEVIELWTGKASKPDTIAVEGRRADDGQVAFRVELWTGQE